MRFINQKSVNYEVRGYEDFHMYVARLFSCLYSDVHSIKGKFNGIEITVAKGSTMHDIEKRYKAEWEARRK
jgi:hypothetical protein